MKRLVISSVDVFLEDKLGNKSLYLRSLPLRSHVTSVMDSCEQEVTVGIFSNMSWEVSICAPCPLSLRLLEITIFNPALSPVSRHSTISCTRVMKDPVLIHHFLVNPNWSLYLRSIVFKDLIIANFPGLHAIRDIEGSSHLRLVEILSEERGSAGWVAAEIDLVLNLSSVLLKWQVFVSFKDWITFV